MDLSSGGFLSLRTFMVVRVLAVVIWQCLHRIVQFRFSLDHDPVLVQWCPSVELIARSGLTFTPSVLSWSDQICCRCLLAADLLLAMMVIIIPVIGGSSVDFCNLSFMSITLVGSSSWRRFPVICQIVSFMIIRFNLHLGYDLNTIIYGYSFLNKTSCFHFSHSSFLVAL